jgi:4-amino-4-deoxy-L-arabinose transferase-like glycosyltransferase
VNRVLLLILLLAALASSRGITDPWSHGDHNGWGGAFYSNIARNYLRYGYLETRFAPVVSTGRVPAEERRYYLTHPPGIGLAVSFSFALFGEHEWSARLVPLAFTLGSILLVFRLGEKIFSSRDVGLLAEALFALAPLGTLYGAHVDPQGSPVTFAALLLLLAYIDRKPALGAAALLLGAAFDWPVHYLAGLLALHAWLFRTDSKRWSAGLLLGSFLLVGTYLLYTRYVAPNPEAQYLESTPVDAFFFWMGIRVPPDRIPGRPIEAPGVTAWLSRMEETLRKLYTIPLLLLAVIGAGFAASKEGKAALWILLVWGLAHVLLFPLGAFVHDYWSSYLGPGLSLAAAFGLVSLSERAGRRRRPVLLVGSGALSLYLLVTGILRVEALPKEPVVLGPRLRELTKPDEGVLLLNPIDARDEYYADRVIRDRVNRVALFEDALQGSVRFRYFVVPQQPYHERPQKPLFERLAACCRVYEIEDYYLFDLEPLAGVAPHAANP